MCPSKLSMVFTTNRAQAHWTTARGCP